MLTMHVSEPFVAQAFADGARGYALKDQPAPEIATLERRTRDAERAARQLRELADALAEAEQRERKRIAHVIHENVQQLMAASKLHIAVAQSTVTEPAVIEQLAKAKELLAAAIEISRSLTVDLGAAPLEEGLAGTLRWLATRMREWHGLAVEIAIEERLPELAQETES